MLMMLKNGAKLSYRTKIQTFITYLCPGYIEGHIDGIYNVRYTIDATSVSRHESGGPHSYHREGEV